MVPNRLKTLVAVLSALMTAACSSPSDSAPVVLAAASLQEAMTDVVGAWTSAGHAAPKLSFAGSSSLARQVEGGAKADIFVSADQEWMDELARKGLLRDGTRQTLLGNEIVLIAPRDGAAKVSLDSPASILAALGGGRLAMADPEAVPAGRYGKAALESFGIWPAVSVRIAPAENVRAALALVERGQAPLGVVYATDARASDLVMAIAHFPAATYPPIHYPAAILRTSENADATQFFAFLQSEDARRIFVRHGFTIP